MEETLKTLYAKRVDLHRLVAAWNVITKGNALADWCSQLVNEGDKTSHDVIARCLNATKNESAIAKNLGRLQGHGIPILSGIAEHIHCAIRTWLFSARAVIEVRLGRIENSIRSLRAAIGSKSRTNKKFDVSWKQGVEPKQVVPQVLSALRIGGASTANVRDVCLYLCGEPRGTTEARKCYIYHHGQDGGGQLEFWVERVERGSGEFYPRPDKIGLIQITKSFMDSTMAAWKAAAKEVANDYDYCWWVEGGLKALDGPSAAGAIAALLLQLVRSAQTDAGCVILAELLDGEKLGAVSGIKQKIGAVVMNRQVHTSVVFDGNLKEAKDALPADSEVNIVAAKTLEDAYETSIASVKELVEYLHLVLEKAEETPWQVGLSKIKIEPRVYKKVFKEKGPMGRGSPHEPSLEKTVDSEVARLYEEPTTLEDKEEVPWNREIRTPGFKVILGAPGCGKTILTQLTVMQVAKEELEKLNRQEVVPHEVTIPIFLKLADLAKQNFDDSVDAVVGAALGWMGKAFSPQFRETLKKAINDRRAIVVLDALDEAEPSGENVIRKYVPSLRDRVVVTCRTASWDERCGWVQGARKHEYELTPFQRNEIEEFIAKWFSSDKSDTPKRMRQIVMNKYPVFNACSRSPLILTLLCFGHEAILKSVAGGTQFTRVQLYEAVIPHLLREKHRGKKSNRTDTEIAFSIRHLRKLALHLFQKNPSSNRFELKDFDVLELAKEMLKSEISFLTDAAMIVPGGWNKLELTYSFCHRTFLEFFAAYELIQTRGDFIDYLVENVYDPAFEEVTRFAAGIMNNPDELLQRLKERDEKDGDIFHRPLLLACECIGEIPNV